MKQDNMWLTIKETESLINHFYCPTNALNYTNLYVV